MRFLVLCATIASLCGAGEAGTDPALEAAKATHAKEVEVIQAKAEQETAKSKSKLNAAYEAAIKRAMAKGDLSAANALKAEMAGMAPDAPAATSSSPAVPIIAADVAQRIAKNYAKLSVRDWDSLPGLLVAVDSKKEDNGNLPIDKESLLLIVPHPEDRWKDEDKPTGEFFDYAGFSKENNKKKDGIAMQVIISGKGAVSRPFLRDGMLVTAPKDSVLFLAPAWKDNGVGIKHAGEIRVKICMARGK